MSEFFNHNLRPVFVAAACAGTLVLTACAPPETPPPNYPTAVMTPTSAPNYRSDLPAGPCSLDAPASSNQSESIDDTCIKAYANTKIAVVNYDLAPDTANSYIQGVTGNLIRATNGLLHPTLQIIPASQATKEKIAASAPKDSQGVKCVNDQDLKTFVSAEASKTMPELDGFDFIVGLSTMSNCDRTAGGLTIRGRYTDIFDPPWANDTQATKENVMTHELLHDVALGHAAKLDCKINDGPLILNAPESPAIADLTPCLGGVYTYDEYGEAGEPLGSPDHGVKLNPIHLNELAWPMIAKGTVNSKERLLGVNSSQKISDTDAQAGTFSTFRLEAPVTLNEGTTSKGEKGDAGQSHNFDEVAIVPTTSSRDIHGKLTALHMDGVDLYLMGDGNTTAYMGSPDTFTSAEKPKTWIFKYGDMVLKLTVDTHDIQASLVPQ